jgi:hypothetical protein
MTAQVGMISDLDTRSRSDALKSLPSGFEWHRSSLNSAFFSQMIGRDILASVTGSS